MSFPPSLTGSADATAAETALHAMQAYLTVNNPCGSAFMGSNPSSSSSKTNASTTSCRLLGGHQGSDRPAAPRR